MKDSTISLPIGIGPDSTWTGKRFVRAHQAHVGPFSAFASTEAGAKRQLVSNVSAFLVGWEKAEVLFFGGFSAVVLAEPRGTDDGILWTYTLVTPTGPRSSTSYHSTRDDAVAHARYAIADAVAAVDYFNRSTVSAVAEWLGENENGRDARDLLRYCAWQRAAVYGQAAGASDVHAWACRHEGDYVDTWTRPEVHAATFSA